VVRVLDSDAGVVGDEAKVEVITGTPAAVPVVPSTPDTALPLAQIAVGANVVSITDSDITDLRTTATTPFPASIDNLGGVTLSSETDGDTLVYSGGTWVNQQPESPIGLIIALGG
jgi:hypothetical protein